MAHHSTILSQLLKLVPNPRTRIARPAASGPWERRPLAVRDSSLSAEGQQIFKLGDWRIFAHASDGVLIAFRSCSSWATAGRPEHEGKPTERAACNT